MRPARLPSLTRIASDRLECVLALLLCGRSSIALPCLGSLPGGSPPLSSQSCLLGRSSPLASRSALLSWGEFSHTLLLSLGLPSWPRACKSAPVGRKTRITSFDTCDDCEDSIAGRSRHTHTHTHINVVLNCCDELKRRVPTE